MSKGGPMSEGGTYEYRGMYFEVFGKGDAWFWYLHVPTALVHGIYNSPDDAYIAAMRALG